MPDSSSDRLVAAIIESALKKDREARGEGDPHGPVVTLSRSYGSGGREVARLLAERLGVKLYDKELFRSMLDSAQIETYLLRQLDEHVQSRTSQWIHTLLTGHDSFKEDYRRHLVNTVLGIAEIGGVIMGRGANHILNQNNLFRVRVVGSPEVCAHRVVEYEGIEYDKALKAVESHDADRAGFIRSIFRRDIDDARHYDMVLNTDRISCEQCVDIILEAMARLGLHSPLPVA